MMDWTEKHERMIAAMKRTAVQQSHEVRQHMMPWIKAFENGVTDDNALVISIPAYKDGALVGHLDTTYSFGLAGEPVGITEFKPLPVGPEEPDRGGVAHE